MSSLLQIFVIADTSYSYGYTGSSSNNNNGGWFSGIRAKLSQLTGISEWMSQLGIGNLDQSNSAMLGKSLVNHTTPNISSNHDDMLDDVISYNSIKLDDIIQTPAMEYDSWDWNTCLLADLDSSHQFSDTLERQHFGPLNDLVLAGEAHQGQGHSFQCINLLHPTWCDKCGDFIWGILRQAVKCEKCNYTCHQRCQELVTLDCRSAGSSLTSGEFQSLYPKLNDGTLGTIPKELKEMLASHTLSPKLDTDKENGNTVAEESSLALPKSGSMTLPKSFAPSATSRKLENLVTLQAPSGKTLRVHELFVKEDTPCEWTAQYEEDDLARKVTEYNLNSEEGLQMILSPDGNFFSGHIQIHMNFTRPISIVAGENPPTVYDIRNTVNSTNTMKQRTITSFFLPRNTVKTININSTMTTRQMIVTLLRKFRVADNPRKFALYECSYAADEETLMRKMIKIADDVCPLKVVLNWPSVKCGNILVLQENDTGDIMWDAFEVPELENFLRILTLEEQQYSWQIKQRYNQYQYYLNKELQTRGVDVGIASAPPLEYVPPLPKSLEDIDPYGTSDSMIVSDVFHTTKDPFDEPAYVNIEEMRREQSTRL